MHRVSLFQGIDGFGVDRSFKHKLRFEDMDIPVPVHKLKTIEFKRNFKIPDQKPQGAKGAAGCYNHSWILTDQLVCWEFVWDKPHQVSCACLQLLIHSTGGYIQGC